MSPEGERVATSSQFLLDAESNLREAIARMLAARPAGAAAVGSEPPPAGHVH
ncbi:MAG: hypothetical protein HC897_10755 [Thermoanaerobaculia bacterium]|nr:hypothetical protein [Thermoanaerobaculia bacterium]